MHTSHSFEGYLPMIAVCARSLAWYPIWMLLFAMRPTIALQSMAFGIQAALFAVSVLATALLRFHRRTHRTGLRVLCAVVPVLLIAGCGVWVHTALGLTLTILLCICLLTASLQAAKPEPEALFTVTPYVTFLTGQLLLAMLLHFVELPYSMPAAVLVTAIETIGFLLLRNQFTLQRMVNRRSGAEELPVPNEIRRGNLRLMGGIFCLVGLLFLLRKPLQMALLAIQSGGIAALKGILSFLVRFIAASGGNAPEAPPITDPSTAQPMPSDGGNALWTLVLWILVIALVAWVWYWLLRDFLRNLADLVLRLRMRRTAAAAPSASTPTDDDAAYQDIESLSTPEARMTAQKRIRRWKQQVRAWSKSPDSQEKFDRGYRLLLEAPPMDAADVRTADTVTEIRRKWAAVAAQPTLDATTDAFRQTHYADAPLPTDAIAALQADLTLMTKFQKGQTP